MSKRIYYDIFETDTPDALEMREKFTELLKRLATDVNAEIQLLAEEYGLDVWKIRGWRQASPELDDMFKQASEFHAHLIMYAAYKQAFDMSRDLISNQDAHGNVYTIGNPAAVARHKHIFNVALHRAKRYAPHIYNEDTKFDFANLPKQITGMTISLGEPNQKQLNEG